MHPDPAGTAAFSVPPELRLVLDLLKRQVLGSAIHDVVPASIDWDDFLRIAQENRLLLMTARTLQESGAATPQRVGDVIRRYRALTFRLNGANLVQFRSVMAALQAAGIEAVGYKGPATLAALYGDGFVRPSTDIDLLVRKRDFRRAGAALERLGYRTPKGADTIWWRRFLGEQHYFSPHGPSIDLHHLVQQPGCPSPRSLEGFFRSRAEAIPGGTGGAILSPLYSCLVACLSLAKAVANREPAGAYACDIAVYIAGCSGEERQQLVETARKERLYRTLCFGLRTASVLFGVGKNTRHVARVLKFLSDDDLVRLVLDPVGTGRPRFWRTRVLMSLCDGPGAFGRELCWMMTARLASLATPRSARIQQQMAAAFAPDT